MDESEIEQIRKSFVIEHIKREAGRFTMPNTHVHECYELYYLVKGNRDYFIHDRSYKVEAGSLVLIPPHVIHRTLQSDDSSHQRYLIYISQSYITDILTNNDEFNWFESFLEESPLIKLVGQRQIEIMDKLKKLDNYSQLDTPYAENMTKVLVMELLLYLIKLRNENSNEKSMNNIVTSKKINIRIQEIIQYLNMSYMEYKGLKYTASRFYVSPYHLSRSFKKATGFGLNEYVNQVRILEAEKLLVNTNLSILDISEKVGYESSTHFGRVFKKLKHMPAKQYRGLYQ